VLWMERSGTRGLCTDWLGIRFPRIVAVAGVFPVVHQIVALRHDDFEITALAEAVSKPALNERSRARRLGSDYFGAIVIVMPDVYAADPMVVVHERFISVKGKVQNQDGVVHVKAETIMPLHISSAGPDSHDFPLKTSGSPLAALAHIPPR
jgi:hypothetical protein